jgi:hypothetical protein
MKKKSVIIAVALIVLAILLMITKSPEEHTDPSKEVKNPEEQTNATPKTASSNNTREHSTTKDEVEFTPFKKIPFVTKKSPSYQELAKAFGVNLDHVSYRENTCDVLFDGDGKIVKMEKNRGLYKSVSKWPQMSKKFFASGYAISNADYLPYDLQSPVMKYLYSKALYQNKDNVKYPPLYEIEIFPCQFVMTKEQINEHDNYGIEIGKLYDGVFVIISSGRKYEQNVSPIIGAEGIPWEQSLERSYILYGFVNYKKKPETLEKRRLLPENELYVRHIKSFEPYELRIEE